MKKSLKWLLLVIIIIIIAIILYVLSTKWLDLERETYENTRYGFSVKYPAVWTLGGVETNNAGREFYSPDEEVVCYAYGFANALLGASDKPQTLDEFIDWLTDKDSASDIIEIIQRETSRLAGKPAISLLIEQDSGYKKAIYTLGKETGIGFFCTYPNMETMNKYAKEYGQMVMGFEITASLDGEITRTGTEECDNLINGAITPLKDLQAFTDTKYTEVTMTSRNGWDKDRLPRKVTQLEGQGYTCYPMPLEFDNRAPNVGVHSEPAVTKVEWSCELEYDSFKYLASNQASKKNTFEDQGYTCQREECLTSSSISNFVWLCTK